MSRQRINNYFGNQLPAVQARPMAQTEHVQQDRWRGLAEAFAQGGLMVEQVRAQKEREHTERATKFANSVTVDELGKRIKAGDMLTSEFPVFAATVQHIWGANTQVQAEQDVLGKVARGELKFASPAEADSYLTETRNTLLQGTSRFSTAGFDKARGAFRQKLMAQVVANNDTEAVTQAGNAVTNFLMLLRSQFVLVLPRGAASEFQTLTRPASFWALQAVRYLDADDARQTAPAGPMSDATVKPASTPARLAAMPSEASCIAVKMPKRGPRGAA